MRDGATSPIARRGNDAPRRRAAELAARALLLGLLGRMHAGAVIIVDGGRRHLCGRPVAGEIVPEVTVLDPRAWRAIALDASAGLGRAYADRQWTTASLDELAAFLRLLVRNLDSTEKIGAFRERLRQGLRRRSVHPHLPSAHPSPPLEGLGAHDALGADAFELFLDETMAYSCAVFDAPETSLHDAQVAKLDLLCRKLELRPADDVVEIGTGWGSFALHAARTYGCRVTTLTSSKEQAEFVTRKVAGAGLGDLVSILHADYRELSGSYDRVVSIETAEALDFRHFEPLFERCSQLLKPTGLAGLQAVVIADRYFEHAARTDDFVKRYIFPDISLPSIPSILHAAKKARDLELISLDDIGHHYSETFRRWRNGFALAEGRLHELGLDERLMRLIEFYFCFSEAAFAERRVSDIQCVFAKPMWRNNTLRAPTS